MTVLYLIKQNVAQYIHLLENNENSPSVLVYVYNCINQKVT